MLSIFANILHCGNLPELVYMYNSYLLNVDIRKNIIKSKLLNDK